MSYSEDDEQPSDVKVDSTEEEENSEEDSKDDAAEKPANEMADEPEEDFAEEEEVLAPKPFPRTIQLTLPGQHTSLSSFSTGLEKRPTCVHVCLTRGTINLSPRPPPSAHKEEDENEEEEKTTEEESMKENEDELDESEMHTTAARLQGCCAEAHCFEKDYAGRLSTLRCQHVLRRLHGDPERQRRFLELERKRANQQAESDEAGGGEQSTANEDADPMEEVVWPWSNTQHPPPYWLPSLLANDAPTFHRVLHVMYGWVIAPEPHPSDRLRLNSAGQLIGSSDGTGRDKGEGDEEDMEQTDPANHDSDFFLPSNAFGEGEGDDDKDEENSGLTDRGESAHGPQRASKSLLNDFNTCDADGIEGLLPPEASSAEQESLASPSSHEYSKNPPQKKLSTATAPPPVVALPSFPFTHYEFFIANDTTSKEWHLLDTHPLFVMEACRRRRAAQQQGQYGHSGDQLSQQEDEDEDDKDNDSDKESSKGEDSPSSEQDGSKDASGLLYPVPTYDIQTLIPVSPIILAALFSAPALRCGLLQPLKSTKNDRAAEAQEDDGYSEADEGEHGGGLKATQRVSDRDVLRTLDHAWLSTDVSVALPILATICRARQLILQQDVTRIPYPLGPLWLDVSPLLALAEFRDASRLVNPADVRQWCVGPGEKAMDEDVMGNTTEKSEDTNGNQLEEVSKQGRRHSSRPVMAMASSTALPHKWGAALDNILPSEHYGCMVLSALLAADMLPTRAVGLSIFHDLDGLRLALWWWLSLPQHIIYQWGIDNADGASEGADGELGEEGEDGVNADNEDDEDEDEDAPLNGMQTEEATEVLAQRVAVRDRRSAQQRRRLQRQQYGQVLLFAPLLQRVLLELQRRFDRCHAEDSQGNPLPPSQFSMQESVARTYAVERLDSGRPRHDPLVTTSFVAVSAPGGRGFDRHIASDSSEPRDELELTLPPTTNTKTNTVTVRHHRLYQSDLVLLALALTTTPAPGTMSNSGAAALSPFPQRCIAIGVEDVFSTGSATDDGGEDAHIALFRHLLEAKLLRCVRSPVERARVGTTKLLLLCAADFCLSATRKCVFAHLPSYELFGSTGYCPLPELVHAWANAATRFGNDTGAADQQTHSTVVDFAFYFWSEVRWRLQKGQYAATTVAHMRNQLPELFTIIEAHTVTYSSILVRLQSEADVDGAESSMSSNVFSRSLTPHAPPPKSLSHSTTAASMSASTPRPLTVAHPNVYSAAVQEAKVHVYDLWHTFLVAPATYLSAETLYILLFGRPGQEEKVRADSIATTSLHTRRFNTAALRVLLENGINMVQPCPLDTVEMPAIEAALCRSDVEAVKVLLGLGAASLHDLRMDGSATLESWAEAVFRTVDMEMLRFVEAKNGRAARCDPRVQYGARRFESAAMQVQ